MTHCYRLLVLNARRVFVAQGELTPLLLMISANPVCFYLLREYLLGLLRRAVEDAVAVGQSIFLYWLVH